jgi:hypothetical protein
MLIVPFLPARISMEGNQRIQVIPLTVIVLRFLRHASRDLDLKNLPSNPELKVCGRSAQFKISASAL